MELATIAQQYQERFTTHYASRLLPSQGHALSALRRCRTPAAGELQVRCTDCAQVRQQPLSCGHRSCPKCQNHEATQWLDRQRAKLLPVEYFMITFTLPAELRPLAWRHQHVLYTLFFDGVSGLLKDFGLTPKNLGADIGMTVTVQTRPLLIRERDV